MVESTVTHDSATTSPDINISDKNRGEYWLIENEVYLVGGFDPRFICLTDGLVYADTDRVPTGGSRLEKGTKITIVVGKDT